MPSEDRTLRDQLIELLRGGSAHVETMAALADFPADQRSAKPAGSPHSAWQLLEHIRFALDDLLEFSTNPQYLAPKWPEAYWPEKEEPSDKEWKRSVTALHEGLKQFEHMIGNPESNLYAKIPWGDGQTLLHEALLAADHTSYHLGQIVLIRKQLGSWKG
jgi:DinB superfamily